MIHLPTLVATTIGLNLLLSGLMLVVFHVRREQLCFVYWSLACFTFALGGLVASARIIIDLPLLTILVADILLIIAPLLATLGIRQYRGLPMTPKFIAWVLGGLAGIAVLLALLYQVYEVAQLITALVISGTLFWAVRLLNGVATWKSLPKQVLRALFLTHAIVMLGQAVVLAWWLTQTGVAATNTPTLDSFSMLMLLESILVSHMLLAICTAMAFPLLVFVSSERKLFTLANYDDLTNMFNRRAFHEQAQALFAESTTNKTQFCVLMIDLDYFKLVNDQHGHAVGDACLKWVAAKIQAELRETDVAARIGGEEFAVALPGATKGQAERVSRRLCEQVAAQPYFVGDTSIPLTISVGGTHRRPEHHDFQVMLMEADSALYQAKEEGRNRVVFAKQLGTPNSPDTKLM